jgi:phage gp36-like protein
MPYATPTAYLQRFGLEEAVQLLQDEEHLLTTVLLQDAMAVADGGVWTGAPSAAEQAAGTAALARLLRQLETTASFMDGYLRAQMSLPLAPDDANAGVLAECCLALARCGLADDADNATERMDKTCETWRKWLVDISKGHVQLVNPDGDTPPRSSGIRSGQAASGYNWAAHSGGPTTRAV